jgi:hypothetical protein
VNHTVSITEHFVLLMDSVLLFRTHCVEGTAASNMILWSIICILFVLFN